MMDKVILTVAPTGNVPTRKLNPYVPLTPDEIAEDILRCYNAGAAIAHIHARTEDEQPTPKPAVFKTIIEKVREKCDIIIQLSTGSRGGKTAAERGACIDLKPEMVSLATGSSNFAKSVNLNPPELIRELAQRMLDNGVKPEIEIFDLSMLEHAVFLAKKGILKTPMHINLVLGVPGSLSGDPRNLFFLVESLPKDSTWSVTSIGKTHRHLSALTMALGGHVRTGIEDVMELDPGKPVSNLELVQRLANLARACDRPIATAEEAREMLGLNPGGIRS